MSIKNNTASFELINNLSEPVQNISIEITKLDIEGNVIEIDTMSYRGATRNGETGPFLEPKEWSMFATSVPEGMTSGKARVLDYNYKE